jgi:hypothetical protein
MKQQHLPARVLMGIVSLTHIVTGLVGIIPPIPIAIALAFYGATKLDITPQFEHILQMYGAYMFGIGILAAFATWNPLRNKAIIYGVSILLFVRVVQRLFFFQQANEAFGISAWFYWVQTAIFLAFAVLLILFRPKANELPKG